MFFVFLIAAVLVLIGGVGGLIMQQFGVAPGAIADHLPMIISYSTSGGAGLAVLGVALAFKKIGKYDRVMGGTSTSSRLRRQRMSERGKAPEGDGLDDEVETPRPGTRRATSAVSGNKTPAPGSQRVTPRPTGRVTPAPGAARTTPRPASKRTTPIPTAKANAQDKDNTRQMRRVTGRVSNRHKA